MPTLRTVLDTNVLLSGIAYPASVPGKLIAAWKHGALDVVLSTNILDELRRVLTKLAHRHGLGPAEIEDLIDALAVQKEPKHHLYPPITNQSHKLEQNLLPPRSIRMRRNPSMVPPYADSANPPYASYVGCVSPRTLRYNAHKYLHV